jgi:protein-S-isoprenylcysteine O-methyltransferase Ste14
MARGTGIRVIDTLARRRVTLGFVCGALVFWLAQPTWRSLVIGASVAACGEATRLWAAGHLEKSREVTRSGPYRWTRHPLYVGSSLLALGVAIASASLVAAVIIAIYVGTTIPAAMVAEERHLRAKFGGEYDAYAASRAMPMARAFSLTRARLNREHHTVAGVVIGFALLALKLQLSLR